MNGEARPDRATQLSLGLLRPCLLAHVQDRAGYGYELRSQLAAMGLECDLGTVYRVLNTLEGEGLLRSTWERSPSGRTRRRYELSEAGVAMADAYSDTVEHFVTVATAFLEMRSRVARKPGASANGSGRSLPATAEARGLPDRTARSVEAGTDSRRLDAAPPDG